MVFQLGVRKGVKRTVKVFEADGYKSHHILTFEALPSGQNSMAYLNITRRGLVSRAKTNLSTRNIHPHFNSMC